MFQEIRINYFQHIQMTNKLHILLDYVKAGLELTIAPQNGGVLSEIGEEEALDLGEARYQLREGQFYEYDFNEAGFKLESPGRKIVVSSNLNAKGGLIQPNIFVGTLELDITGLAEGKLRLEVLATKFSADGTEEVDGQADNRVHYRAMLDSIAEKCTELLFQLDAPVSQLFDSDFERNSQTLYQRFAFLRSVLTNNGFGEAVAKIISNPKTQWINRDELVDSRSLRRFSAGSIRQLLRGSNRTKLPEVHPLQDFGVKDLPTKIISHKKFENVDTPENRVIKHLLEELRQFCEHCKAAFVSSSRGAIEAAALEQKISGMLQHNFFKEISRPQSLRLNSPALQRKSGYREVLQLWLRSQVASHLTWQGGEYVYEGGKRDVAKLYEYWLFFKLHDLVVEKFKLQPTDLAGKILKTDNKGVHILLKSGKQTIISSTCEHHQRKLKIRFSYNRSFSGNRKYDEKLAGSYTKPMIPDYTISVWPEEIGHEEDAEKKGDIVHIHFDAKYKVRQLFKATEADLRINQLSSQENLMEEDEEELGSLINETKRQERQGVYKDIDLLKMHAYKDAIRRTGGAYVLYPGEKTTNLKARGFHEIIPGLGAFAVNPAHEANDLNELGNFFEEVINHLLDRTSQREQHADKTYQIFQDKKSEGSIIHDPLPEYINDKKLIPAETKILVGRIKSKAHQDWIINKNMYNFRADHNRKGSLEISPLDLNADYLLLYQKDKADEAVLFNFKAEMQLMGADDLLQLDYPEPRGRQYLVVGISKVDKTELQIAGKKLTLLRELNEKGKGGKPFVIALSDLMRF